MTSYSPPYRTAYPPRERPLLVWDGDCRFCRYWIIKWEQACGPALAYAPYQEAAGRFPDLDRSLFKGAVQLIDTNGQVYPGAAAAFRSLCAGRGLCGPEHLYRQSKVLRSVADAGYHLVSTHRSFFYQLTLGLLGKDPRRPKPYWLGYLGAMAVVTIVVLAKRRTRA